MNETHIETVVDWDWEGMGVVGWGGEAILTKIWTILTILTILTKILTILTKSGTPIILPLLDSLLATL